MKSIYEQMNEIDDNIPLTEESQKSKMVRAIRNAFEGQNQDIVDLGSIRVRVKDNSDDSGLKANLFDDCKFMKFINNNIPELKASVIVERR